MLRDRFEALPSPELGRLCAHETLAAAMVATIQTLTGVTPRLLPESGNNDISHLAWCVDGGRDPVGGREANRPGRIAIVIVTDRRHQWTLMTRRQFTFINRWQAQVTRIDMLREHLGRAMMSATTLDAGVRQPWRPLLTHAMSLRMAFALWWDARMVEGHTPESAWTLLSLIAEPSVLTRFTLTADGPHLPLPVTMGLR